MDEVNEPITPLQTPDQMHSSFENSHNSKVIPIIIVAVLLVLVGVGSYFLGTKKSATVVENKVTTQPSPIPTPTPTPTPDPTANWQTYTNTLYSFKYPTDWSLARQGGEYNLDLYDNPTPIFGPGYTIRFFVPERSLGGVTISDPVGSRREDEEKISDTTLDQKPAVRIKTTPLGPGDIPPSIGVKVFLDSSKVLHVRLACVVDNCSKYDKLFDQILSTLKFTE